MGIQAQTWSTWLRCCSAHGQDCHQSLSSTNLPSSPSASSADSEPSRRSAAVHSEEEEEPQQDSRSRERIQRRLDEEMAREQRREEARQQANRLERERLLADHSGDSHSALDDLLAQVKALKLDNQDRQAEANQLRQDVEFHKRWVREFRPEKLEDIDDAWTAMWTPFHNKAALQAFYEVFVLPRLKWFQRYRNYAGHKLEKNPFQHFESGEKGSAEEAEGGGDSDEGDDNKFEGEGGSDEGDDNKFEGEGGSDDHDEETASPDEEEEELVVDRFSIHAETKGPQPRSQVMADIKKRDQRSLACGAVFRRRSAGENARLFTLRPTQRCSRPYTPHKHDDIQLNCFQEFLIYMIFLRRGLDKDILAQKFFGQKSPEAMRQINCLLRTWAAAMYEVLRAEDWWLKPEHKDRVKSKAFAHELAKLILCLSDCTNVNCESSKTSELIRQQLYSLYYKTCCGKYNVSCSIIGGTVSCAPGMGGPASDHACMEAAQLFEEEKWAVPEGKPKYQCIYDAGISTKTKTFARIRGCDLRTSGIVRKNKNNPLSCAQRDTNFEFSSLRIRVENFIGIVKQKFKVLKRTFAIDDLGIMDKVVYTCFMLHNFGHPIIN
jgi:hypothetical protein